MKKIIAIILGVVFFGVIVSFTTAKTIEERTKTETVYVQGMKYVIFHSNGTIQVANVTKDLLEIESYKKK
ncbi:MAG: hypothetical protein ACOH1N_00525 [Lutibacter sp.]